MVPNYKKTNMKNDKMIIFSYINIVYYFHFFKKWMSTHGNKKEAIIIKDFFIREKFDFYSVRFNGRMGQIFNKKPTLVFGIEPNFSKLCEIFPNTIKVYYATGSYFSHQNEMIISRTDKFNSEKNTQLPYIRLAEVNDCAQKSDYILQIGSSFTIETYPIEYQNKIKLIRQTSFNFPNFDISKKKALSDHSRFIWLGSTGSILKGLDLVIDYFSQNPKLHLDIVGPIDDEFLSIYKQILNSSLNIKWHGFVPIKSKRMLDIMYRCTFIILPSASEGMPGSVINSMKMGLIPILSKYAAFNSLEKHGILIESLDFSSINNSVKKALELSLNQIDELQNLAIEYVNLNHSIETFTSDLESFFNFVLKDVGGII